MVVPEVLDHLGDDRNVVLQIGVERNRGVGFADLRQQSGEQRVLVADIARQLQALHAAGMLARRLLDQSPGAVAAAVVDEQHVARGRDVAHRDQLLDIGKQQAKRVLEPGLFIVARNDESDGRRRIGVHGRASGIGALGRRCPVPVELNAHYHRQTPAAALVNSISPVALKSKATRRALRAATQLPPFSPQAYQYCRRRTYGGDDNATRDAVRARSLDRSGAGLCDVNARTLTW